MANLLTPFQYLDKYHQLKVQDAKLGLDVIAKVRKYKSGWAGTDLAEAAAVIHRLKGVKDAGGGTFYVTGVPAIDPAEPFYKISIQRAFAGRASPDELSDALRLAVAGGRVKLAGAQAYAETWFGLDCNSYTGNYLGLSPNIYIGAFVGGLSGKDAAGSKHIAATAKYLPFPPRESVGDASQGDVLVWFTSPMPHGGRYPHVGVLEGLTAYGSAFDEEGDATVYSAEVRIAQWGMAWDGKEGGLGVHKTVRDARVVDNVLGWKPAKKEAGQWADVLGALKGIAQFKGKSVTAIQTVYGGKKGLILVMDSSTRGGLASRGWHCGTTFGV